ncbi:MAG: hypothetical protein WD696_15570 [Bryobacteraceae bacterium]
MESRVAGAALFDRKHIRLGNLRLIVALVFVGLAWAWLSAALFSSLWLLLPIALFAALVVKHERVVRAQNRVRRSIAFYERGLSRLEDRWAGQGESGERFRDSAHPYAEDLDLFGKGSIFELISTARTRVGEERLATWLLAPAGKDVVCARHEAILDLRDRLDLREDLAILGEDVRTGVHPEALMRWAEAPPALVSGGARIAAAALTLLALLCIAAWQYTGQLSILFGMLALVGAFGMAHRKRVLRVVAGVEEAAHDLALLSEVLARFEKESFRCSLLAEQRARLETSGKPPSARIARLHRLVELIDSRDHVVLRAIGPPLLYTTHLAFAVEAWRAAHGGQVRSWLEAVAEMEALCSLSGYAWERPSDPFPEFSDTGPLIEGEVLCHPLLPGDRCVPNDVSLGAGARILVISGSNMSGKSTYLRTVGVNTVLAMAGAPVRARRLRLSPLAVGASIRVIDSLQGGTSRFYAEIKRLRNLLEIAEGPLPLLFLLDELLHGTNSHDRRIGAEGVVRSLERRHAIGLVTTHDLALADVAEALAPTAANVHFEDRIEDGHMTFDYRMRPGVVRKSNALELMRSIGLDV